MMLILLLSYVEAIFRKIHIPKRNHTTTVAVIKVTVAKQLAINGQNSRQIF
jgi:hypothetical protein